MSGSDIEKKKGRIFRDKIKKLITCSDCISKKRPVNIYE